MSGQLFAPNEMDDLHFSKLLLPVCFFFFLKVRDALVCYCGESFFLNVLNTQVGREL